MAPMGTDRVSKPWPDPVPLPDLDPAWLASLGERRGAAAAEWDELRAQVKRSAYPDALPRLLGEARAQLMAKFTGPQAAGGAR
jgi:hypothetical protein